MNRSPSFAQSIALYVRRRYLAQHQIGENGYRILEIS
jgi:hypothetical protein